MTEGMAGHLLVVFGCDFHTVSLRLYFSVKYHTLYSGMCNISSITSLTKNQILPHSLPDTD